MKISQWLGYNEESSQYLLRRGELRALVNLQPRRPGMLVSRHGLVKLYGKYDDQTVVGIHRHDTIVGSPSDFLCFQKVAQDRVLTTDEILAGVIPREFVWVVRRIKGYQERVIHELPLSPNGTSLLSNFCVAEDRHGRIFMFFGHGATPIMFRPSFIENVAVDLGMDAPKIGPTVEPFGEGYFLEAIDVLSGGGSYWGPPTITVDGGDPDRPAKVKGIVQGGNLVGVEIVDGGSNFKTFPKVIVGSDRVGSGFRAVGNMEQDPGVQGFVDTTPAVVSGQGPTSTETVGVNNELIGNKVMYLASPVTASTKTVAQASSPTTTMTLQSVAGIHVGDVVTIYSGSVPAAFASGNVVRVLAVNESAKSVTLSKSWTPAANTSYFVQFRSDQAIGYAEAQWNEQTRRFRASVPLRTTRGAGSGAESTLSFTPVAYSYGLGNFKAAGYTTPESGPVPAQFAFKRNGWNTYLYDDYWQGAQFNKKNSTENRTYAGLQASGRTFAFGYSGAVDGRRGDVYWADYSSLSVWLCTGVLSDDLGQWVRADVPVIDGNTSEPYILVTLRPTAKARLASQSGKLRFRSRNKARTTAPDFRLPVVKLKLKTCPDSWVTSEYVNGEYNLPFKVKETRGPRIAWWHQSAVTPRPIVDFRGSAATIDWDTIEVVDPGAGWERGTVFALRIHQANPYEQRTDYNVATRPPKIRGAHQPFSRSSRYAQFLFKATSADNLTPAGPPNTLDGSQYVDVIGNNYRSGDTAEVTLLKRNVESGVEADASAFDAVLIQGGDSTEFTFSGGTQNPGAVLTRVGGTATLASINVGDIITCETDGILFAYSQVIGKTATNINLDKMRAVAKDATVTLSGDGYPSPLGSFIDVGAATSEFFTPGQRLWDTVSGDICTITELDTSGPTNVLRVTGTVTSGARTYRPVFSFTVAAGVQKAQTLKWTAEQIAAGTGENKITSIRIISSGRNYFSPPSVLVRGGGNGYGLAVIPKVEDGKIVACDVVDPGRAYTAAPELYTDSSAATAVPAMRPAIRGKYRCAYRFVDRSETVVLETTVTATRGDSPTTVTLASVDGLEEGMILESPLLPLNTSVLGVNGNDVELSQPIKDDISQAGSAREIIIENGGYGYAADEEVTATIQGDTGGEVTVSLRVNDDDSFSVDEAICTVVGSTQYGMSKIPVTFSPPAAGGAAASGYAIVTELSSSLDRSVIARDFSKPVSYSNFSPIVDVDAGPNEERPHCSELRWSVPGVQPPLRADMVELWRTSADQSLVFYRAEAYGIPSSEGIDIVGSDTLTDEELFDPERANYAAMPVVLPNGSLNAYRFGKPRTDMAVCVAFQDRLWYGVSTSGDAANTLFYSEFDEFESCPDLNELPIQNNQRATDSLTALVPFGSMLLAMQHTHTYALTYNTDPGIDASIQMMSHRGVMHQRCWDMHENVLYAADESGIYSLTRNGEVSPISAPVREYFTGELLDFSKRESFFLAVCPRTHVLRFFCCLASQPADTPTFALCYDIERQVWWTENYPNSLCSAVTGRPGVTRVNGLIYGGVDGHLYEMDGDSDHANDSVTHCEIRNGGSGYRRSPRITCPNSDGVRLKGVVSEGRLVDILVQAGGWGCSWGPKILTESGLEIAGHDGLSLMGEEYVPITLDIEPPPPGGDLPNAAAHFSVTTRLVRDVTASEGESFVRINSIVQDPITTFVPPYLLTQDGKYLTANGAPVADYRLQCEYPAVEVGMEAIGDFLPLNAFVSKLVGPDIYLEHPDGTPVVLLGGAPRTDEDGDGFAESGGTQAAVYFRKAFKTHIPYRLATGAMQLINEDNVNRGGDTLVDRSITMVYTPTESAKNVEIIEYFNDSSTPRPNVMRRERGGPGGFEHRQDSASTVLNMARDASHLADATGVAKAKFASRVYTDSTGEDQHVQVELYGRPDPANGGSDLTPHKFIMHSMTINGVIEDGE